jgi:hypothetical protein
LIYGELKMREKAAMYAAVGFCVGMVVGVVMMWDVSLCAFGGLFVGGFIGHWKEGRNRG